VNVAERNAVVGLFVWVLYLLAAQPGPVDAFLTLAPLVHLPLALPLIRAPRRLVRVWPLAAGAFAASAFIQPGTVAAFLTAPWLAFTIAIASCGVYRLAWQGLRDWRDVAVNAGCLFLAVGGAWALASRAGWQPLGFAEPWVVLTAVHFHYAAFVLPLVIGVTGRLVPGRGGRVATAAVLLAIPLTAIGIAWSPALELVAALLLVLGALGTVPLLWSRPQLRLPAVGLGVAMLLAAGWAVAPHVQETWLPLEQMAWTHGTINAVLFSAAALFALGRLAPPDAPTMPPFSRLRGTGKIGADWFERAGVCSGRPAKGLVDDLDELTGPGFDPGAVDDRIRAFYEHTDDFELRVVPDWAWWIRPGARLWAAIARRLDQTQFPLRAERDDDALASHIVGLDARADGRELPRGWVRTFADGRAMYVAAYSTHRSENRAYMNIAFPMPGANLASILAPRNTDGGGLVLDTSTAAGSHCGIWLVFRWGALRLPMREDITVELDDGVVVARHVLRLLGVRYLTFDYRIRRTSSG
jgi:hypothetical protein